MSLIRMVPIEPRNNFRKIFFHGTLRPNSLGGLVNLLQRSIMPFRLKKIFSHFGSRRFKLLDIGCGDISPLQTQKYLPNCEYHGVDRHVDEAVQKSGVFLSLDLEQDSLVGINDNSFDAVVMTHVIEHLHNPLEILKRVCKKVKSGGMIYLEFPSLGSLGLPSRVGTLQFCDDSTHVHLPNPYDVANLLLGQNIKIVRAKIRRDPVRLMCTPLFASINLVRKMVGKDPKSKGLWDFWGFAFYIYGIKK